MENNIILLAAIFNGSCALISFLSHTNPKRKQLLFWSLSALLIISTTVLILFYFITSDFHYQYVSNHSSNHTKIIYKISAMWSGQEGSFLLWSLFLEIFGFFLINSTQKWSNKAIGIYSIITFCINIMCFITMPFSKNAVLPQDGLGLNEALKDPWMIIHPPMVFIAYSALAILFSLLPALKYYNEAVSKLIVKWLRVSLCFLGIGIITGSIWAYRALGWGGYWAWDPIENAALIPWLILCSFLHMKTYHNKYICAVPFSTACFGVFLARSGILQNQSVHAYAGGNKIITGILILFLFGILIFLVLSKTGKHKLCFSLKSAAHKKDRLIIYLLNGYAFFIFIGTLAPILFRFEMPIFYYNIISIIFTIIYIILLLWMDFDCLKKKSILMLALSTLLILCTIILLGVIQIGWLLLLWFCLMPICLWIVSGFHSKSKRYYFVHTAASLLIIGIITSSTFGTDSYAIMNLHENNLTIQGAHLTKEELTKKDMIIVPTLKQDILIKNSEITISNDNLIIPYSTKPFIILFWLGGFVLIFYPFFILLLHRIKKRKRNKIPSSN